MNKQKSRLGKHLTGEIPHPVLLNTWKHHAGVLRSHILEHAAGGENGLAELAGQVAVLGHELTDLYVGRLTPLEIAQEVLIQLRTADLLDADSYKKWLSTQNGYGVLTFPQDRSRWVLRLGEENGRYVHVHPARWAPQTRRVRANVLKTAVLVNAYVNVHGGDRFAVGVVNRARQQYLNLSPMRRVRGDQGLRPIIELLNPNCQ